MARINHQPRANRQGSQRRDDGMTLIELLISISVLGTIVAVIASAMIVMIRTQPETESRLDVARWEQSLALWLPSDLTSASNVSADEADTPCASAACTFGSNALELRWDDGTGETIVSYRYGPSADGETFELHRIECHAGSCFDQIVLRDLAVPSDDDGVPIAWASGDPVPDTVINVTVPLAVGSSGACDPDAVPADPDCDTSTRAQRVIVNVNGAPGLDGVDRSSTVSFTAGGSTLGHLEPASFSGPSFLQANSGCGGPITLVVDNSNSLSNSDISNVKTGVRSFVNAFEGTPTKLQIVTFGTVSKTMGTTGWNRYFDLSDPADVLELMGPTGNSGLIGTIQRDGGTNWEDALFRTFYSQNGTPYRDLGNPAAPEPEMVVFFTDGEPTMNRTTDKSDTASTSVSGMPSRFNYSTAGNTNYGADFTPEGWWRADHIVDNFREIRFIGVGVGSAFDESTPVQRSGWPSTTSRRRTTYTPIPKEVFLGDLTAGGDPSQYGTPASGGYVVRRYSSSSGWGDVSNANLLVTNDMTKFGSALTEIALAECGGTLTVQTRDQAGNPADAKITYQIGDEVVTTTRITKAGTFDIPLNGIASATVDLIPQSFDGTGYTPVSWNCRAGGASLAQGSDWDLITPGTPGDGISITVSANAAVSCTLSVSP
jgi:prepilin-type N-terminal cleavage/methylation domain-containing protein